MTTIATTCHRSSSSHGQHGPSEATITLAVLSSRSQAELEHLKRLFSNNCVALIKVTTSVTKLNPRNPGILSQLPMPMASLFASSGFKPLGQALKHNATLQSFIEAMSLRVERCAQGPTTSTSTIALSSTVVCMHHGGTNLLS